MRSAVAAGAAATAVLGALALGGCGDTSDGPAGSPDLSATGGYIPEPVLGDMAAGYLTVRNDGDADDRLTSVSSDLAADVTLHTTTGDERMRKVDGLDVPAGGELTLARGGDHLMLERLSRKPEAGDTVTLTLRFATSDPIEAEVPVRPTTYRPEGTTS